MAAAGVRNQEQLCGLFVVDKLRLVSYREFKNLDLEDRAMNASGYWHVKGHVICMA